jgi:predicted nucleotidyltransferase
MAIADVLRVFRDLKREGTVRDYLVFGSVAAMVHTRPFYTRDVDIGVATESDKEFWHIFDRLAELGKVEGHSVVIHGTPVEVFPADISPVIQDALVHAGRKRVEDVVVKVASPEHLLLESLRVYRRQDKARVFLLDEVVDRQKLHALLRRLDHDGTLKQRYQTLTGNSA